MPARRALGGVDRWPSCDTSRSRCPIPGRPPSSTCRRSGCRRSARRTGKARGVYLSDGVINLALLHYKTEEAAGELGRGFVGLHHFGFLVDDVAATRKAIEAAGGTHWMGEAVDGTGFYEVKFHDPDGIVVDITANGWTGAAKD